MSRREILQCLADQVLAVVLKHFDSAGDSTELVWRENSVEVWKEVLPSVSCRLALLIL
jgi:hypothetical protein